MSVFQQLICVSVCRARSCLLRASVEKQVIASAFPQREEQQGRHGVRARHPRRGPVRPFSPSVALLLFPLFPVLMSSLSCRYLIRGREKLADPFFEAFMRHTNGLQIGLRQRGRQGIFWRIPIVMAVTVFIRTARTCLQQIEGDKPK